MNFQANEITHTPAYVVDEALLLRNLETLAAVKQRSGAKVLLALKGFSMHGVGSTVAKYLDGTAASSLNEAHLGAERFGGEVHIYAPAYVEAEIPELVRFGDHIVFNSLNQFRRFGKTFKDAAAKIGKDIQLALRVNHGYSEVQVQLYNPCAPGSRFGVLHADLAGLSEDEWKMIDGLHFHTMCQQGAEVLARTVAAMEERVGQYLPRLKFVNLGGGHHITRPGYNIDLAVQTLGDLRKKYGFDVYVEPGEAVALFTGFLVTTVLDIIKNDLDIAILDTSATAHMPDVIEMPYRPEIINAGAKGEHPHLYRLGGLTCLAGDVIGDYSFPKPLHIGDRLVFTDMAHYTMVKNTQFNGVNLPDIGLIEAKSRNYRVIKHFDYTHFRDHLS